MSRNTRASRLCSLFVFRFCLTSVTVLSRCVNASVSYTQPAMSTPLSRRQLLTATISGAAAFAITGRAQKKIGKRAPCGTCFPGLATIACCKASFVRPMTAPPLLRAGTRKAAWRATRHERRVLLVPLSGLEPKYTYQLMLGMPPADLSGTRGPFRHFPALQHAETISAVCVYLRRRTSCDRQPRHE